MIYYKTKKPLSESNTNNNMASSTATLPGSLPGSESPDAVASNFIEVEKEHYEKHRYGHHHNQIDHVYHKPHRSFFPGFAHEFSHDFPLCKDENKEQDLHMPVLHDLDRGEDLIIHHSSPGYEINENETHYQIALDVPGVHLRDLTLQLEEYGHMLYVMGSRLIHYDGELCQAKFEKRFRIGNNIDHDAITAHLSEGVLLVTAPKLRPEGNKSRRIFIFEGQDPLGRFE